MRSTLKPQKLLTQPELSTQPVWVHFHAFSCVFGKTSRAVILQQQTLRELTWLKHTDCNTLLVAFQQPACWASFTNTPTSQGSHCCFGHKEAFSLAINFPQNILHAESCAHHPAPSHHNAPQPHAQFILEKHMVQRSRVGIGIRDRTESEDRLRSPFCFLSHLLSFQSISFLIH